MRILSIIWEELKEKGLSSIIFASLIAIGVVAVSSGIPIAVITGIERSIGESAHVNILDFVKIIAAPLTALIGAILAFYLSMRRGAVLKPNDTSLILASLHRDIARGTLGGKNTSAIEELQKLILQLQEELKKVPVSERELADAVAVMTADVVHKATEENPNRTALRAGIDMMRRTAETLKDQALTRTALSISRLIVAVYHL
jgi:hypothetical protein